MHKSDKRKNCCIFRIKSLSCTVVIVLSTHKKCLSASGDAKHRNMNVMETLMERMSKYTEKLQEAVEERSAEVVKEKKKCDELLSKMLPRYIYTYT